MNAPPPPEPVSNLICLPNPKPLRSLQEATEGEEEAKRREEAWFEDDVNETTSPVRTENNLLEDDPLDAFMKTLEPELTSLSSQQPTAKPVPQWEELGEAELEAYEVLKRSREELEEPDENELIEIGAGILDQISKRSRQEEKRGEPSPPDEDKNFSSEEESTSEPEETEPTMSRPKIAIDWERLTAERSTSRPGGEVSE